MQTVKEPQPVIETECPRCDATYGRQNHRCILTDGTSLCYECTLDVLPPMAETEKERLSDWLAEARAAQVEWGMR
jgi:hypothetical protein